MNSADLSTTCYLKSIDTRWAARLTGDIARIEAVLFHAVASIMGEVDARAEINWRREETDGQLARSKAYRCLSPERRSVLATASVLAATVNGREGGIDLVARTIASM